MVTGGRPRLHSTSSQRACTAECGLLRPKHAQSGERERGGGRGGMGQQPPQKAKAGGTAPSRADWSARALANNVTTPYACTKTSWTAAPRRESAGRVAEEVPRSARPTPQLLRAHNGRHPAQGSPDLGALGPLQAGERGPPGAALASSPFVPLTHFTSPFTSRWLTIRSAGSLLRVTRQMPIPPTFFVCGTR